MFHIKRKSPKNSPVTVQDVFAHRTVKNPGKYLTICSLTNPKLKQPSLLLADDTISMDQESTCPTPSLKMSKENFENNQADLFSEQNIQSSSLFPIDESLYQLPSQRITPIGSMSEIDEDNGNVGSSTTNEIKMSLKTIRSNNDISGSKTNLNAETASAQSNCLSNRRNLQISTPRTAKGRPYTGAPHSQYQRPITGRPDLEYHLSTRKNQASQYFKMNETNQLWAHESSSPATARESTDIWRNPECPPLYNIVFEPPKSESQKAGGVRAKLKACVGVDASQPVLLIKSINEKPVPKADKTPKAPKTTVASTLKCQSYALIPNSPGTCNPKIKTASMRILTSEPKSRFGEKLNSQIPLLV